MNVTRQAIPIGGLLTTVALAAYMVAKLDGQAGDPTRDFTSATVAEVRDAQDQVILRGRFVLGEEDDDDVEQKARLEPAGLDADAAGEAEVEFDRDRPVEQDVEFSVRNLEPGVPLTFVIDGTPLAVVTTDRAGRARIELEIALPGVPPGR